MSRNSNPLAGSVSVSAGDGARGGGDEFDRGHRVVAAGPYRLVRHPMYVGIILQNVATPLILGSRWTFAPVALVIALFLWRTAR